MDILITKGGDVYQIKTHLGYTNRGCLRSETLILILVASLGKYLNEHQVLKVLRHHVSVNFDTLLKRPLPPRRLEFRSPGTSGVLLKLMTSNDFNVSYDPLRRRYDVDLGKTINVLTGLEMLLVVYQLLSSGPTTLRLGTKLLDQLMDLEYVPEPHVSDTCGRGNVYG